NKTTFLRFKDYLAALEKVTLDFILRPRVTYSLRAMHAAQKDRALFVMVDVIEDTERWLAVCFYGDMVSVITYIQTRMGKAGKNINLTHKFLLLLIFLLPSLSIQPRRFLPVNLVMILSKPLIC
ncbi:MAG: hypothetical protein DSY80_06410, partial [Desulfocapsa sp.]